MSLNWISAAPILLVTILEVFSQNAFKKGFRNLEEPLTERPAGGMGCVYSGVYREINEVFLAGDSCNMCICDGYDHMICSLLECGYDTGCAFVGQPYDVYEHFPLGRGCHSCYCHGLDYLQCDLNEKC